MFDLGAKISKKKKSPKTTTQKTNLERENREVLNDFSSRLHVCDNECFLLYTLVCSGRSSVIWVTNSGNLFGAGACETATSRTQWFNTVWTICHVLAKEGAEPWNPTDFHLVLFLTGLVPAWRTSPCARKLQTMVFTSLLLKMKRCYMRSSGWWFPRCLSWEVNRAGLLDVWLLWH